MSVKRKGEIFKDLKKKKKRRGLEESVGGTVGRGGDDDGLAGTRSGSLDTV